MLTNLSDIFRVVDLATILREAEFPVPDYMHRADDYLVCCWESPKTSDRMNASYDFVHGHWLSFWWDLSNDEETDDFTWDATSKEAVGKRAWAWAWESTQP